MLMRTAEVTSGIRVADVDWGPRMRSVRIKIWRTKTVRDQGGVKIDACILEAPFSGVRLLRLWWRRRDFGPDLQALVFPAIQASTGKCTGQPASDTFFREALKGAVASVGKNPEDFSGHSARAGGATDLFASGAPYPIVKAAGRWKSDVACLYNRDDMEVAAAIARGFNRVCRAAAVPEVDIDTVLAPGG